MGYCGYQSSSSCNKEDDELTIIIPKGDSILLNFTFEGDIPAGTNALFTVKGYGKTVIEYIITVEESFAGGEAQIYLSTEDTNIRVGEYKWDLRFIMGDDVLTPESPAKFIITEVVGDATQFYTDVD